MKLYTAKLSLFGRKVEIALAEKGLAFERVQVPFSQTRGYSPKDPFVLAHNPKGQVPVLVDGDLVLYESTIILEYLEDAYPTPALYPREAAQRARCRQLEGFADEVIMKPLNGLMHRNEPHDPQDARWLAAEERTVQVLPVLAAYFDALEHEIQGKDYMCGVFSVADIALAVDMLYSERLAGPSLLAYPALLRWAKRVAARPSVAQVVAEIRDADAELSAPVAGAMSSGIFPG